MTLRQWQKLVCVPDMNRSSYGVGADAVNAGIKSCLSQIMQPVKPRVTSLSKCRVFIQDATIAQLAEQPIYNRQVSGSNPGGRTTFLRGRYD